MPSRHPVPRLAGPPARAALRPSRFPRGPREQDQADDRDQQAHQLDAQEPHRRRAPRACEGVPQRVQHHGARERPQHASADGRPARPQPLAPKRGGHQPRPRQVPGRRGQAAQDQDLVEHGEVAAGLEQRDEAVAHSLQAREARSGRHPYQEPRGLRAVTAEEVEAERGDGIVLRGGEAKLSKDDRQVHLAEEDAHELLDNALQTYREEHKTLPARLVLHKTSPHNRAELAGFGEALRSHGVDSADFLSLARSYTRLFRGGEYPPLRGTFLTLDERAHLLYTRGSVDFFRTYPGMYVPRPLLMRCEEVEQTPTFLAREALALTKMNWNNSQFDNGDPITLRAARNVGDILKYIEGSPQPRYSYYM